MEDTCCDLQHLSLDVTGDADNLHGFLQMSNSSVMNTDNNNNTKNNNSSFIYKVLSYIYKKTKNK